MKLVGKNRSVGEYSGGHGSGCRADEKASRADLKRSRRDASNGPGVSSVLAVVAEYWPPEDRRQVRNFSRIFRKASFLRDCFSITRKDTIAF